MSLVIRPATGADHSAIARLTLAAYEADGQLRNASGYAAVLADVAGRAKAGDLLVAVDDAAPSGDGVCGAGAGLDAGIVGAVLFVRPGSPYAEISRAGEAEFRMLAVDPVAQGRGVGRALVLACIDKAEAAGCTAIAISVRDLSLPAQKLYNSFGFVRTPALDWSPAPGIQLLTLRLPLANGDRD